MNNALGRDHEVLVSLLLELISFQTQKKKIPLMAAGPSHRPQPSHRGETCLLPHVIRSGSPVILIGGAHAVELCTTNRAKGGPVLGEILLRTAETCLQIRLISMLREKGDGVLNQKL